ncbi:MAG TPA: hypothetical protein VHY22_03880 [Chthoniobacteraceae bacterium]|nr:hypothetical protein [Chthoniobacteraceae bacterium]
MEINPFAGGVYGLNLSLCEISPETGDPGKRFKDHAARLDTIPAQIAKRTGQFIINRNRRSLAVFRGRGPDVQKGLAIELHVPPLQLFQFPTTQPGFDGRQVNDYPWTRDSQEPPRLLIG